MSTKSNSETQDRREKKVFLHVINGIFLLTYHIPLRAMIKTNSSVEAEKTNLLAIIYY